MNMQASSSSDDYDDLYKVADGRKPFVTAEMNMKFEAVSSTPLAGAHNEYLILFKFVIDYQLPPGSQFRVVNLVGSVSARSTPLHPPRCGNDLRCACGLLDSARACCRISGETRL